METNKASHSEANAALGAIYSASAQGKHRAGARPATSSAVENFSYFYTRIT